MRGLAPALGVCLLASGATPSFGAELAGCWRHTQLQSSDGIAVEIEPHFILDLCFPQAERHGVILASALTPGCGLGFEIRYRLGLDAPLGGRPAMIRLFPNQLKDFDKTYAYRFGKRGETLILVDGNVEPMVFERTCADAPDGSLCKR